MIVNVYKVSCKTEYFINYYKIIKNMSLNSLSLDILSNVFEYTSDRDRLNLVVSSKKIYDDIRSFRELTDLKRIVHENTFIKTLESYLDNRTPLYLFDIPKIKIYLKEIKLNDTSLVVNGTSRFCVDGTMIKLTTDQGLHVENMIKMVIQFTPYDIYRRTESLLINGIGMPPSGVLIYKFIEWDIFKSLSTPEYLVLINIDNVNETTMSQLKQNITKSLMIILGPSVTSIGSGSFSNFSRLRSIVIPDSVKSIGDDAFYYCTHLSTIVIPDSITRIGERLFNECTSLRSIVIPNSVKSIDVAAFYNCRNLPSIVIPDSVTTIGEYAFSNCKSLSSIVIPDSVTNICRFAFIGCNGVTSLVISNSLTELGVEVFRGCSSLTSIVIPKSVTSIGVRCFHDCTNLTSIAIPDSVTSIGVSAFENCASPSTIVIPKSVTSIGRNAFNKTPSYVPNWGLS
jgi:hypothetical protein